MKAPLPLNVKAWLAEPLPPDLRRAIERIAAAPDVRHVAIMPDVHLAHEVCVGTVVATEHVVYPAAVGSDIGCGIATVAFDREADCLRDEQIASELICKLRLAVPIHRHREANLPSSLSAGSLQAASLRSVCRRDGAVQLGTLGRGNHFLEFQSEEEGRLWLMVHSGSRAIGHAIRRHYESRAQRCKGGLRLIDADSAEGTAYLSDVIWARRYAQLSRRAMIDAAAGALAQIIDLVVDESSYFDCDHNHVRREFHLEQELWVHRKGAICAAAGERGVIPGSMGTESFHVTGRGNSQSLQSASHGAGRAMSRDEARRQIPVAQLRRQMAGVAFDSRSEADLREEAPAAYKDIRAVLRAEADLVRIVRRLKPVLSYKGT